MNVEPDVNTIRLNFAQCNHIRLNRNQLTTVQSQCGIEHTLEKNPEHNLEHS